MITEKLQKEFNEQITAELWSSQLYLQMAFFLKKEGWDGFAHWMEKQFEEENEPAQKMIDYAIERGGDIEIGQINVVPTGWGSPLEVFEHVYSHECKVSEMIDKMVDIAEKDRDHASRDFLFTFVREQVEEERTAKDIVDQLKAYGEHHYGIMDHKLGKR